MKKEQFFIGYWLSLSFFGGLTLQGIVGYNGM